MNAVQKRFYPFIESSGFYRTSYMSHIPRYFRRRAAGIDHLDIHWDKYGQAKFKVLLGFTPPEFPLQPDRPVPDEAKQGRFVYNVCYIKSGNGIFPTLWHGINKSYLSNIFVKNKYTDVEMIISEIIEHWPEAEDWLVTGKAGPHLKIAKNEVIFKKP